MVSRCRRVREIQCACVPGSATAAGKKEQIPATGRPSASMQGSDAPKKGISTSEHKANVTDCEAEIKKLFKKKEKEFEAQFEEMSEEAEENLQMLKDEFLEYKKKMDKRVKDLEEKMKADMKAFKEEIDRDSQKSLKALREELCLLKKQLETERAAKDKEATQQKQQQQQQQQLQQQQLQQQQLQQQQQQPKRVETEVKIKVEGHPAGENKLEEKQTHASMNYSAAAKKEPPTSTKTNTNRHATTVQQQEQQQKVETKTAQTTLVLHGVPRMVFQVEGCANASVKSANSSRFVAGVVIGKLSRTVKGRAAIMRGIEDSKKKVTARWEEVKKGQFAHSGIPVENEWARDLTLQDTTVAKVTGVIHYRNSPSECGLFVTFETEELAQDALQRKTDVAESFPIIDHLLSQTSDCFDGFVSAPTLSSPSSSSSSSSSPPPSSSSSTTTSSSSSSSSSPTTTHVVSEGSRLNDAIRRSRPHTRFVRYKSRQTIKSEQTREISQDNAKKSAFHSYAQQHQQQQKGKEIEQSLRKVEGMVSGIMQMLRMVRLTPTETVPGDRLSTP